MLSGEEELGLECSRSSEKNLDTCGVAGLHQGAAVWCWWVLEWLEVKALGTPTIFLLVINRLRELRGVSWRRESSRETLKPISVSKEAPGELEKHLGQGLV